MPLWLQVPLVVEVSNEMEVVVSRVARGNEAGTTISAYLVTDAYADWLLGNADYNVNDPTLLTMVDSRSFGIKELGESVKCWMCRVASCHRLCPLYSRNSAGSPPVVTTVNSCYGTPNRLRKNQRTFAGHLPPSSISSLAFNDNGKTVAGPYATDNSVRLWDRLSGQEVKRLEGHTYVPSPVNLTIPQ